MATPNGREAGGEIEVTKEMKQAGYEAFYANASICDNLGEAEHKEALAAAFRAMIRVHPQKRG